MKKRNGDDEKRVQRTNGEIGEEIVEEGNWTNEAKNQGTGEDSKQKGDRKR